MIGDEWRRHQDGIPWVPSQPYPDQFDLIPRNPDNNKFEDVKKLIEAIESARIKDIEDEKKRLYIKRKT